MKNSTKVLFDVCMEKYPSLHTCSKEIMNAFNALLNCFTNGGKVLVCGNGGSAADAEHIVGEFMKKFRVMRPVNKDFIKKMTELGYDDAEHLASKLETGLPAISLVSQTSLITAVINDVGGEYVFAQQVYGYGKPNDVLIALSTSGNSANVVAAVKVARALGMAVIGFTNVMGGKMKPLCNINICVPDTITFQIQELHLPVYHLLCAMVEEEIFGVQM
ncbi:MAG: SIS domain-containing protein [Fibrobacterota bacterium]|nr:SIS domain-containing protein [Chitinispirillaceae bacterium]